MEIPINVATSDNDTQQRQELQAVLGAVVSELAVLLGLDLTRIEAITVAANIDSTLAQFDDGGIETGRTLTRTRGELVGVGMTPVCIRAGSARCHIFLPASQVAALSTKPVYADEQRSIARYVVAHELGHAHDLAQRARHLEPHVMKTPGDLLTPPVFWQLAEICWNEYAACRLSASTYPELLPAISELLIRALQAFSPSVRDTLLKCKAQRTSAPAFGGEVESLSPILKYSSYVLGHVDGLGASAIPAEVTDVLNRTGVMKLFDDLADVLREMWMTYPTWTALSIYEPLIRFLKNAFRFAAVEVYEADGQLKSKLVLAMLPSFGIHG